jgi:hypothetical protein
MPAVYEYTPFVEHLLPPPRLNLRPQYQALSKCAVGKSTRRAIAQQVNWVIWIAVPTADSLTVVPVKGNHWTRN